MGRASTWKNRPTASLPVPIAFKPVLREAGRALDAAEAVSFEREVTDCNGITLSFAIAISVVSTLQQVAVPITAAVIEVIEVIEAPEVGEVVEVEEFIDIQPSFVDAAIFDMVIESEAMVILKLPYPEMPDYLL